MATGAPVGKRKRDVEEVKQVPIAPVEIVFPGDVVSDEGRKRTKLRQGLLRQQANVIATRAGILKRQRGKTQKLTVLNRQKRYIPRAGDLVVGTVLEKHAENYNLDVGGPIHARLPTLAFEGATKRNRPNIPVGALVYARVEVANKHMEPELSCISPHFKKDWVTGQSLFGELTGGYLITCSLQLATDLLSDDCAVLNALGQSMPFELAIGMNGRVWIKAQTPMNTVIVANCIVNSEHLSEKATLRMVARVLAETSS